MYPSNYRSHTYKVSLTWLSKSKLNSADMKTPQAGHERAQKASKHYGQLSRAGGGEGALRGRAHQLVVQRQVVSPENMHVSNIIWTGQYI